MHQPPDNLGLLIEENEWEAQQIIRCYERVPRYARKFRDVARIHVGFSGILLEQFRSPENIDRYRHFVDIPAMIESYKESDNIEIIGMGYYHPIFPLIPREDWDDHLISGKQIAAEMFGREPRGFWPSEMAFDMEMIPALAKTGYEYVVVDSVHVQPKDGAAAPNPFQPYIARHADARIVVVPRDRDISNAQESGMNAEWFSDEVSNKVETRPDNAAPHLVTTWSDGENGGWFRQMAEEAGFFGHFFTPFVERVRSGDSLISPVLLSDFLEYHPPQTEAHVQTGAWNVADTSGYDFSQWAGSDKQREAIGKIFDVSRRYWALARGRVPENVRDTMSRIRRIVLESETSCFLFWGDYWIPKLYERTRLAEELLGTVERATH
ncbi:MAG: glycoside hydrolase family 57 [Candidatus Latescibacteria bacterium]|nr:glycoside hydrolase family 57 [Candidatus Latescibacterota bacterium]NIM22420.1 glycoside hydrolase family 57 [Candidatus Latescibacterota bacterium]NIM64780.1 glycoside hydrolase family 57 [Candidatus Latescibacterota bacterium]NIO01291.1 glycoside hydrolase family 57 [Candidatus Latescibacterota bacterium]NIO27783.1 glycoside hydrolase family 57 [Candidatus Latescibacterota bacterium]